jgi:hypothetical protein
MEGLHSFIHSFYETGEKGILREGKLGGLESEIYSGIYSAPGG